MTKILPIKWRACHDCFPPGDDLHDENTLETCITCKKQYCRRHFRVHLCEEVKKPVIEILFCSNCEEPVKTLNECLYCGEDDLCQDCIEGWAHKCENWDGVLPIGEKELQNADYYYELHKDVNL